MHDDQQPRTPQEAAAILGLNKPEQPAEDPIDAYMRQFREHQEGSRRGTWPPPTWPPTTIPPAVVPAPPAAAQQQQPAEDPIDRYMREFRERMERRQNRPNWQIGD